MYLLIISNFLVLVPAFWQAERVQGRQQGPVPEDPDVHGQGGEASHRKSRPADSRQDFHVQGKVSPRQVRCQAAWILGE